MFNLNNSWNVYCKDCNCLLCFNSKVYFSFPNIEVTNFIYLGNRLALKKER